MCFPALSRVVHMLTLGECLHVKILKIFSPIYILIIAVRSKIIFSSVVASKSLQDSISCAGLGFFNAVVSAVVQNYAHSPP